MIKAIFFDLGNVLVGLNLKKVEKGYMRYGYKPDGRIWKFIMDSGISQKYMRGKISSREFYEKASMGLGMKIGYKDFYRVWNSMFYHFPDMEKLVRTLNKKYPKISLILVSDTNKVHFEFIREKYKILDLLDHYVVSFKVGEIKPNPVIYKAAIKLAQAKPREIFYADDRPDLIKAVRKLGLRAFHFTGAKALRERLRMLGVLV